MSDHPKNYGWLLRQVAADHACGEFAVFDVQNGSDDMRLLYHVRGGDPVDEATTAAALKAFRDVIRPCVDAEKDGIIEVVEKEKARRPRFCLIMLAGRAGRVVGAAAFIFRCDDDTAARALLNEIRQETLRFRQGPPRDSEK